MNFLTFRPSSAKFCKQIALKSGRGFREWKLRLGKESPGEPFERRVRRGMEVAGEDELRLPFLKTRSMSVRNSISSKIFRSSSSFGSSRTSSNPCSSCDGNINFDGGKEFGELNHFPVSFHFRFQVLLSVRSVWRGGFRCCHIRQSVFVLFSPTPGQPGMLSELSPISPSMSMTCAGD